MKKMIKLFLPIFILVMLLIPTSMSVFASDNERVFDMANLFSAEEKASLEAKIQENKSTYNQDFVIVTTNDADGKSSQNYADDYFDYNGFGVGSAKSGFLFLIDLDNGQIYISTSGNAKRHLNDERLDNALDELFSEAKSKQYYASADLFLDKMAQNIEKDKNKLTIPEFLIALAISLAVGGIFIGVVCYKYGVVATKCAYPLKENSKLNLKRSEDNFINKTVTHVTISNSSNGSGGGGTSTHTSSSGRSHGGGGRSL